MDFASTGPVVSPCVPIASQPQSWEGCHTGADEPLGLPAGFPSSLDQPLAWTGAQFQDEAEYVYQLTGADLAEINSGLRTFKGGLLLDSLNSRLVSVQADMLACSPRARRRSGQL